MYDVVNDLGLFFGICENLFEFNVYDCERVCCDKCLYENFREVFFF